VLIQILSISRVNHLIFICLAWHFPLSPQIQATLLGKQRQILNTFIWDWRGHKHPFEELGIHVSASASAPPGIALQAPGLSSRWRYYLIPYSHPAHVKQISMQNPIVMHTHNPQLKKIEQIEELKGDSKVNTCGCSRLVVVVVRFASVLRYLL